MDEGRKQGRAPGGAPASAIGPARSRVLRIRWAPPVAAAVLLLAAGAVIGAGAATGQGSLVRIGSAPRLPSGAVDLGPAPAATVVSGAVVLRPRDEQGLEAFIAEATRKGSPGFGHYLTRGQFAARFGPGAATAEAVRSRLKADGLQVGASPENGLLVRFSGSSASVSTAFATPLHSYRLSGGPVVQASTSAPALPEALAGSVVAVEGLGGLLGTRPSRVRRNAALAAKFPAASAASFAHPPGSPDACTQARAAAARLGGLTDDQIAYAYGAFGLYGVGDTGAGVHIGVFEEEPFSLSDMQHFDTCYFGAAEASAMAKRLHVISLEGGITQGPGSGGEALLDVEDVSAMAPGAEIDVYENPESPAGEVSEIAAMVDEDRDQIVTSSYGQPCEEEEEEGQPGTEEALNFLFQQGAAQGQTFLGAAGDSGSDNCEEVHRETVIQHDQNPLSGGEIASQPYVLAVGGTTITDATQPAQEHVWNDGAAGGAGGGGISRAFAMPSWQRDATVPGIDLPGSADYENAANVERSFGYPTGFCDDALVQAGPGTPCRLDPDVSGQADEYTGAVTVYSEEYVGNEGVEASPDGWVTSGGTSSATPIWAGMLALADASPTCRSNPATASGVGFVTPLLYAIASNPADYAAAFNDITEGDNDQYGLDDGKVFPARAGFDLASGLGSPRMTDPGGSAGLAYYLCSFAAQGSRPAVTGLSPDYGTTAGGERVKLTGAGFQSAGKADVAGVLVGTWEVPESAIDVTGANSLTITMPPASDTLPADSPPPQDGAGPANVVVSLEDGQSSAIGTAATFQYVDTAGSAAIPSVTGLLPTGGSESAPAPVTILGSDLKAAKSVSFGGVSASSLKVMGDSQILVTPPPYSSHTVCSPLPSGGVYAGENAANDICQVQVVVHGSAGASATGTILPPAEGTAAFEQNGSLVAPSGCGCEVYPAPTEYDYAPPPAITSVSTSAGPGGFASEKGGTLVTIHGAGLNRFTFLYSDFGPPSEESSIDGGPAPYSQIPPYITGTEIQIEAPAQLGEGGAPTVAPENIPLSVRTLAGSSAESSVEYAGIPSVSALESTSSAVRLRGRSGALDTGGTSIALQGQGLAGQVTSVDFLEEGEERSEGTQYTFTAAGETQLDTQTVSENPGLVAARACTVTGCSAASPADHIYLYPPGQPGVLSLSPRLGPPAGGTHVTIRGQNLGCPLAVGFGGRPAQSFAEVPAQLACGSGSEVRATSPAGTAGKSVPVTVTTWESYFTRTHDTPSPARFTYAGG